MGREMKIAREVAESSKARARMKVKAKRERRPNWLPDGWIMKVGVGENGEKVKYYTSPVSRCTFRSRKEVLHYLRVTKFDGHASYMGSFSENNQPNVVAQVRNSPEWLPRGWILEIKTRLSGHSAGKKYKCYFDPFSGSRFYSKAEVLRFLKSRNTYIPTSGEKQRFEASTTDNVLAQIEYSPDGLPDGWIKETIFRRSTNKAPRKDPYYTDPVSGYVFRSLKDATHFVKTGVLGKYAFGPRKKSINEMYSLEKESPPPIPLKELKALGSTRKRLFTEEASTSNGEKMIEIDESPDKLLVSPPDHALSKGIIEHMEGMFNEKRRQAPEAATASSLNSSNHGEQKANSERPTIKRCRAAMESVIEIDESPEKLPPPDHASLGSLQNADLISSPENEHIDGKAYIMRSGLEAAANDSVNTSKHGEQKAKRGRPPKRRFRPEKEMKGSEELEPKMAIEKPTALTTEITPVPRERKQQRSKGGSVSLPRRSSKRLAGLEPPPTTDLVIRRPSFRPKFNGGCNGIKESVPLAEPKRMNNIDEASPVEPLAEPERMDNTDEASLGEPLAEPERMESAQDASPGEPLAEPERMEIAQDASPGEPSAEPERMEIAQDASPREPLAEPERMEIAQDASLREPLAEPERLDNAVKVSPGKQVLLKGQTSEERPSSPLALPFGDAWPDPCIEFAVKTLMGEIPVLDEGMAIEEYVQKQLSSVEVSNTSGMDTTVASDNQGIDPENLLGPVELQKKQPLRTNDEGKSCPLENRLPSRDEASKVHG